MDSSTKLATEKFLAYYEVTKALELAARGKPLQGYKPTEPVSRFTERSKEYLDRQSEWGYGPREFEKRHLGLAQQTVEEMPGP